MDALRLSPPIIAWVVVALIGVGATTFTLLLLRHRLGLPLAQHNPQIRAMLRHNALAEAVRAFSQLLALLIGVTYVFGLVDGTAVAWALVVMQATKVANSVNEFITTWNVEHP
jgi:hypothetical protein